MNDLLHTHEVEESRTLRAIGSFLSLYFFMTWAHWFAVPQLNSEGLRMASVVPSWLLLGADWMWLPAPASRLIMRGLGLVALLQIQAFQRQEKCRWAMAALALQGLAKLFFYLQYFPEVANFHHVHLYFTGFFLLAPRKLYFLRLCLAVIYWMAALVKLSPSWLGGEYFNSLPCRLPLWFSSPMAVQAACLAVIALEMLAPLLLLSHRPSQRRLGAGLFLAFHLYSGVIVGIWYTALMLPFLGCLLWDGMNDADPTRPSRFGLAALLALLVSGIVPSVIPGDVRYSGEGRYLGLFMFDANHRSRVVLNLDHGDQHWEFRLAWEWPDENLNAPCHIDILRNGVPQPLAPVQLQGHYIFNPTLYRGLSARVQNDPYIYYVWAYRCQHLLRPDRIGIQLFSQLDGHPEELQTVQVSDYQSQVRGYNPCWRNEWIVAP